MLRTTHCILARMRSHLCVPKAACGGSTPLTTTVGRHVSGSPRWCNRFSVTRGNRGSLLVFAVAIVTCMSGCVESEVSLSDPETAVVDRGLLGQWVSPKGDGFSIEAVEGDGFPKGMMRVRLLPHTPDKPSVIMWATQLADNTFLNVPFTRTADGTKKDASSGEDYAAWSSAKSRPVHIIMLRRRGDTMSWYTQQVLSPSRLSFDHKKLLATLASSPEAVFDGDVVEFTRNTPVSRTRDTQPSNSDARLLLLAIHHASQLHLTCKALGTMVTNDVPNAEIRQILDPLAAGIETVTVPLLNRERDEKADDPDAVSLLDDIVLLQQNVLTEVEAIKQYALVDRSIENAANFGRAKLAYEQQREKLEDLMTRIKQGLRKDPDGVHVTTGTHDVAAVPSNSARSGGERRRPIVFDWDSDSDNDSNGDRSSSDVPQDALKSRSKADAPAGFAPKPMAVHPPELGDGVGPRQGAFSAEEWREITASLIREGRVPRKSPEEAKRYLHLYTTIRSALMESGVDHPTVPMMNAFKNLYVEAIVTSKGPDAASTFLIDLMVAAKDSGRPLVTREWAIANK